METKNEGMRLALGASAFIALFVSVSYVGSLYREELALFVEAGGVFGVLAFVVLTAFCTIFLVPFDSSVLSPLAANAWGPWQAALMSIAGWTAGSAASFALARRYGRPVAERMIGARRVRQAEGHAPQEHLFWSVVGAQAFIQVDFISYMFGLFTRIPLGTYALATALGNVLPAFFFCYVGALPGWYKLLSIVGGPSLTPLFFLRFSPAAH